MRLYPTWGRLFWAPPVWPSGKAALDETSVSSAWWKHTRIKNEPLLSLQILNIASRIYFSVSKATRMLSRVSRGGPAGTGACSVVPDLGGTNVNLDDPGRGEMSSRSGRKWSALLPTSVSTANCDKLRTNAERNWDLQIMKLCFCGRRLPKCMTWFMITSTTTLNGSHVSSGVCTALRNRSGGTSVDNHRWDSGGGISFSDGDLLRLAGLLATVRTKALPFQHRGTRSMETMGNADIWLTLHEGSLSRKTKE